MSNQAKRLSGCPVERLVQCRGNVEVLGVMVSFGESLKEVSWTKGKMPTMGVELVDRAHLTRLQAEVSALQQRLNIADQRVCDLQSELTKTRARFSDLRDVARDCEHLASSYCGSIDGVEEHGGDDHEDPTCAIWHRLYYAMFDADKALAHQSAPAAKTCSHIWVSADNRGAGAGEICQACSEHRTAAKGSRESVDLNLKEPSFYRNKDND